MLTVICAQIFPAQAEGSRDLYPPGGMGNRGNLEWRTNLYGNLIHRRTLLQVFAKAGEVIRWCSVSATAHHTFGYFDLHARSGNRTCRQ